MGEGKRCLWGERERGKEGRREGREGEGRGEKREKEWGQGGREING